MQLLQCSLRILFLFFQFRLFQKYREEQRIVSLLYTYQLFVSLKPKHFAIFSPLFCLFILFLAVLGLYCCVQAFSSRREWGYCRAVVGRLLAAVASLVVEHGLQGTRVSVVAAHGLSSCSSWAQEHSSGAVAHSLVACGIPGAGIEPVFPALAGEFFTTGPPGKPLSFILFYFGKK